MSDLHHFAKYTLHEVALVFMAVVYTARVLWLLRFKAGRDRQAPSGTPGFTTPSRASLHSIGVIAMPWAMESSRTNLFFWLQFALFHLGVTSALVLSFIMIYAPGWLSWVPLVRLMQALLVGGFLMGLLRIYRRVSNVYMRAMSSPEDHFAVVAITAWFVFAFLSLPNNLVSGEWHLITYFTMTSLLIIYVPFSKISHYLYYPFTRYYLGKTLGHRGVWPIKRSVKPAPIPEQRQAGEKVPASAEA